MDILPSLLLLPPGRSSGKEDSDDRQVSVRVNAIPKEIRELAQWVGWRQEVRDGKPTKVPIRAPWGRHDYAKVSDSATWGTLASIDLERVSGVGFVFTEHDPYCGIDLDGCRDPDTGELAPWARAVLSELDSYAEVSPSRTGVHLILRGSLPEEGRRWGSIEIYDRGRYFTVTGDRLVDTNRRVQALQDQLDSALPSLRLLGRALGRLPGDQRWHDLARGAWTELGFASQSEADLSFVNRLARFDRNAERIDQVFHWSGLYRSDWERTKKYTIPKALSQSPSSAIAGEGDSDSAAGRGTLAGAIEFERNRRAARRQLDQEEADFEFREPLSIDSAAEWLAEEREPMRWRIEGLMAEGDNVLLAALYKAGKTTAVMNATRSLCDQVPFLGQFATSMPGGRRVGFWNLEVSERRFWQWTRELGIEHPERLSVLNLRGYSIDFRSRAFRAWAVAWLRRLSIQTWILDPFAAGFRGDENSNNDVRDFLAGLDSVKAEAGVGELVVVHHFGRAAAEIGEEHGRGAARLDDWADSRWILSKVKGERFFAASGRDVEVEEAPLSYDPLQRRLQYREGEGGRKSEEKAERDRERVLAIVPTVLAFVRENPGCQYNELWRALGGVRSSVRRLAISQCETESQITKTRGPGNRSNYFLPSPPLSPPKSSSRTRVDAPARGSTPGDAHVGARSSTPQHASGSVRAREDNRSPIAPQSLLGSDSLPVGGPGQQSLPTLRTAPPWGRSGVGSDYRPRPARPRGRDLSADNNRSRNDSSAERGDGRERRGRKENRKLENTDPEGEELQ